MKATTVLSVAAVVAVAGQKILSALSNPKSKKAELLALPEGSPKPRTVKARNQSEAAKKAWATMRKREAQMTPSELKALRKKRSDAGKKAWKTRRARG